MGTELISKSAQSADSDALGAFGRPCIERADHNCCASSLHRYSTHSECIKKYYGCFPFESAGITEFCGHNEDHFFLPSKPEACVGANCCIPSKGNVWYKKLTTCESPDQHNDTCTRFELKDRIPYQTLYCGHNDKRVGSQLQTQKEPKAAVQNALGAFGRPCIERADHNCCASSLHRYSTHSECIKTHYGCFPFESAGITEFCGHN